MNADPPTQENELRWVRSKRSDCEPIDFLAPRRVPNSAVTPAIPLQTDHSGSFFPGFTLLPDQPRED